MADYGYMTVTAACPVTDCTETVTTRVFGAHGASVYTTVTDDEGHTWSIKVVITVSGVVTNYEHN